MSEHMEEVFEKLQEAEGVKTEQEVKLMAPLALAYMGDAIFETFIRNYLICKENISVNQMHKKAVLYVKAKSQSEIVHALEKELTEEEWQVVKKGRNQKPSSVPKNAQLNEYRYATGFEALLGFLYYTGRIKRLVELMEKSVIVINEGRNENG
jgi:ribonuclease III family protein